MAIEVQIANRTLSWRLRHSQRLTEWIGTRPWLDQGSAKVVRLADVRQLNDMNAYLRQAVWAADDRASNIRVLCTALEDGSVSGLAEALSLLLRGTRSQEPLRDLQRELTNELGNSPLILAAPVFGESGCDVLRDASILVDEISKADTPRPLTFVLYDTVSEPISSEYFDLSVGYPTASLFEQEPMSTTELWVRYLHHRGAWEVAGDPVEAQDIGAKLASATRFDDNEIEVACNNYAWHRMQCIPSSSRSQFMEYLSEWGVEPISSAVMRRAERDLARTGLLWTPIGHSVPRPTSWAARAALMSEGVGTACFCLLRNCTIPVGIASEALGKCFELEMHERAYYSPLRQAGIPPIEVTDKHQDFLKGSPTSAAAFYPPSCPAKPDVWAFASLGAYFADIPRDASTAKREQLRVIRNALSHGHHVGWTLVSNLRHIQDALLGSDRVPARLSSSR